MWTRLFPPLLASLVAFALLTYNIAVTTRRGGSLNRYWLDMSVGIKSYLDWRFPLDTGPEAPPADAFGAAQLCKNLVNRWTAENQVQPWEPWRTMDPRRFLGIRKDLAPPLPWEDTGRAMALAAGFRLLGGVSPYLILWLGALASLPLFLWTAWEFFDAGHAVSGTAFLVLFASSPYVTDCLWWGHSAAGFYLLGLLALVALTTYAVLGRRTSPAGFLLRSLAAGTAFAACALFRSGTLMFFPSFFLALALAGSRVFRHTVPSRATLLRSLLAALILFWAPFLLMRQPQNHNFWIGVWEGLGDFDRTKGHAWKDAVAVKALQDANLATDLDAHAAWSTLHKFVNAEAEEFFRRAVFRDIREDPAWYIRILGQRVVATVTQDKLWPWGPRDGRSMKPRAHPNQGEIDNYYRGTATADFIALGRWRVELPMSVIVSPTLLLLLAWVGGRWLAIGSPFRERLGAYSRVLLCPAIAALALPVVMTTAAPQETQALVLIYFLGFGFALEAVVVVLSQKDHP